MSSLSSTVSLSNTTSTINTNMTSTMSTTPAPIGAPPTYPTQLYSYNKYSGPCLVNVNVSAVVLGTSSNTTVIYSQTALEICTANEPTYGSPAQNNSQNYYGFPCGNSQIGDRAGDNLTKIVAYWTAGCAATPLNASLTGSGSVYTLIGPSTSYTFTTTSTSYGFEPFAIPTQYIAVPTQTALSALFNTTGAGASGKNVGLVTVVLGGLAALSLV